MSNSVAEFLKKDGIKKFKNGIKSLDKHVKKIAAASIILTTVFTTQPFVSKMYGEEAAKPVTAYAVMENGDTLCSYQVMKTDEESFCRIQDLVNNATNSETGCEVLKKISEQGTVLYSEYAGEGVIGFFDPNTNMICLNPQFGDAELQSCLIHESKHSIQNNTLDKDGDYLYDLGSNIMTSRVKEADAVATQTKFSYELAQAGDSAAWDNLKQRHWRITTAFENSVEEHGIDSNETMKATMLAWYDNKSYVAQYDQSVAEYHSNILKDGSDALLKICFKKTVSVDDLITGVCTMNGEPYAGTDGSILQTTRTAYLNQNVYKIASNIAEQTGLHGKADKSADSFYVLNADGTVSDKTYAQQNKEKEQVAVQQQTVKTFESVSAQNNGQVKQFHNETVQTEKSGSSLNEGRSKSHQEMPKVFKMASIRNKFSR